jgi:hypothetical protein
VRLHAPTATCLTVARGTGTARRERDRDTTEDQVGAREAAISQNFSQ